MTNRDRDRRLWTEVLRDVPLLFGKTKECLLNSLLDWGMTILGFSESEVKDLKDFSKEWSVDFGLLYELRNASKQWLRETFNIEEEDKEYVVPKRKKKEKKFSKVFDVFGIDDEEEDIVVPKRKKKEKKPQRKKGGIKSEKKAARVRSSRSQNPRSVNLPNESKHKLRPSEPKCNWATKDEMWVPDAGQKELDEADLEIPLEAMVFLESFEGEEEKKKKNDDDDTFEVERKDAAELPVPVCKIPSGYNMQKCYPFLRRKVVQNSRSVCTNALISQFFLDLIHEHQQEPKSTTSTRPSEPSRCIIIPANANLCCGGTTSHHSNFSNESESSTTSVKTADCETIVNYVVSVANHVQITSSYVTNRLRFLLKLKVSPLANVNGSTSAIGSFYVRRKREDGSGVDGESMLREFVRIYENVRHLPIATIPPKKRKMTGNPGNDVVSCGKRKRGRQKEDIQVIDLDLVQEPKRRKLAVVSQDIGEDFELS